jgi:hypothetical protein
LDPHFAEPRRSSAARSRSSRVPRS